MRLIRYALAILPVFGLLSNISSPVKRPDKRALSLKVERDLPDYNACNLSATGLSREAFDEAVRGYRYLLRSNQLRNTRVMTIIDYGKPSTQKRLYVLDMEEGKLMIHSLVAHGRNSGLTYANDFSNDISSNKSSIGLYLTQQTYSGANGYSLKLKGCERGINDLAASRAIVLHGAAYVSDAFIRNHGYLGRSLGCPAVPVELHKKLIDVIKNGSCMFLYHPTKKYLRLSVLADS